MQKDEPTSDPHMFRRRTTMADGRYFYYYTFDDAPPPDVHSSQYDSEPESEEERDV